MKKKTELYNAVWNMPYGFTTPYKLYDAAKEHRPFVQKLNLQIKLPVHHGCVNTICWNNSGEYILSGSDDQCLCVTHGYNYMVKLSVQTGHKANIFSARFLPNTNDKQVISCSGDGVIVHTNLDHPETSLNNTFACHFGTAYEVLTVPNDPHTFLSCGEDGTVRWFDLRIKQSCSLEECKEDILINCHGAVTSLAVSPYSPHHLGVGSSDGSVRIFDRRLLGTRATGGYSMGGMQAMITRFSVPQFESRGRRITSLCYSPDGEEMLVSYSSDYVYLFEIKDNGRRESLQSDTLSYETESPKQEIQGRCTSQSFLKRMRLTGDWSDTGPSARSQSEIRASGEPLPRSLHSNLMQRMCDVLTRMFNSSSNSTSVASSSPSHSNSVLPQDVQDSEDSITSERQQQEKGIVVDNSSHLSNSDTSSIKRTNTQMLLSERQNKDQKTIVGKRADYQVPCCTKSMGSSCLRGSKTEEDEAPRISSLNERVECVQNELSSRRRNFLERHNIEPVINLHYNGQGMTSGLITMDLSDVRDREHLNLEIAPNDDNTRQSSIAAGASSSQFNTAAALSTELPMCPASIKKNSQFKDEYHRNNIPNDETKYERQTINEIYQAQTVCDNLENKERTSDIPYNREDEDSSAEEGGITKSEMCSRRKNFPWKSRLPGECVSDLHEGVDFEDIAIMTVPEPRIKRKFVGHRNSRTMIKEATFWGNDFVMSGSDCGHIFIWDRYTSQLVMILEADNHVVNCLQPHPFDPILASSGIDHDIKIWAPLQQEPFFDEKKIQEIVGRNKIMLEETKDTITVPASFMIRMLASLNNLRSAGGISGWRRLIREDRESSNNET